MNTMTIKSMCISGILVLASWAARLLFKTDMYLSDLGGIGAFTTIFGTLYGITSAFVVFEVWAQYNRTTNLIEQEAIGLERLQRLTIYFRDPPLAKMMSEAIHVYANQVINGKFHTLGSGNRNIEEGKFFRGISKVILNVKFDDEHDSIVYQQILEEFGKVSDIRSARIVQSLARLPVLLKVFVYTTSSVAILTFIFMPFSLFAYQAFVVLAVGFVISMMIQLIEDLDNPFVGYWTITPEPFQRALTHIDKYLN